MPKKRKKKLAAKAATAKDYEAIITIQEKIIKANARTNNQNIKNFKITYNYYTYMSLLRDIYAYQDEVKKLQHELELSYKDRNNAIRRYNALHTLGKMAKDCGVDLTAKLPEHEKNKWKDFKFNIDTKVLESGKTAFTATAKKKVSQERKDFARLHNQSKKKS